MIVHQAHGNHVITKITKSDAICEFCDFVRLNPVLLAIPTKVGNNGSS